jgi:hypothetical protein
VATLCLGAASCVLRQAQHEEGVFAIISANKNLLTLSFSKGAQRFCIGTVHGSESPHERGIF